MKRTASRRRLLGFVAATLTAGVAAGSQTRAREVHGTLRYQGDEPLPKGRVTVYVADPDSDGATQSVQLDSNGKSTELEFALPLNEPHGAPSTHLVAELARADGWVLARGSAATSKDGTIEIILYTAMY